MSSSSDDSELQRGLQSLKRAAAGVAGRLLGPKAIGREELPPEAAISPEADEAIARAGAEVGRILHATGEGLKAHPLDPAGAIRTARASAGDSFEADPGWTPLAAGIKNLGGGLARVAEGVLDVVAPRRPKDGADGANTGDGVDGEDAGGAVSRNGEGPGAA